MLPLHAGTAILLSMCFFCIGYGLGYLHRPRKRDTVIVRVPRDRPARPGEIDEIVPITSDMSPKEIAQQLHLRYGDPNDLRRLDLG